MFFKPIILYPPWLQGLFLKSIFWNTNKIDKASNQRNKSADFGLQYSHLLSFQILYSIKTQGSLSKLSFSALFYVAMNLFCYTNYVEKLCSCVPVEINDSTSINFCIFDFSAFLKPSLLRFTVKLQYYLLTLTFYPFYSDGKSILGLFPADFHVQWRVFNLTICCDFVHRVNDFSCFMDNIDVIRFTNTDCCFTNFLVNSWFEFLFYSILIWSFFSVSNRRMEDEGSGKETTSPTWETGRGSRQSPERIAEESAKSDQSTKRIPESGRIRVNLWQLFFFFFSLNFSLFFIPKLLRSTFFLREVKRNYSCLSSFFFFFKFNILVFPLV